MAATTTPQRQRRRNLRDAQSSPGDLDLLDHSSFSPSSSSPTTNNANTMSSTSASSTPNRSSGRNPLKFLGLKRVNHDEMMGDEIDEMDEGEDEEGLSSPSKIELNRRGLPARKRKRNSLIYGADDVVSIPVRSPKKKRAVVAANNAHNNDSFSVASEILGSAEKRGGRSNASTPNNSSVKKSGGHVSFASSPQVTPAATPEPKTPKTPASSPAKRATTRSSRSSRQSRTALRIKEEPNADGGERGSSKRSMSDASFNDLELTSPEKKSAQALGSALRNLLKLPKGHKWVCYEFFYSNIDRVLFEGENDFMVCLRESFPLLRTRRLSRVEWCKVRRLMGKPRRCSAAFFAEERAELARKRHKIRLLQQRKQADVGNFKDLPDDIPLQLTIGARVTARLRKPQDGLFIGTVDAYDTSNNTYRITFERSGLCTHSIPDHEVLSTQEPDTMPLSTFTARARPRQLAVQQQQQNSSNNSNNNNFVAPSSSVASSNSTTPFLSPMKFVTNFSPGLANDPLLSGTTPRGKVMRLDGQIGGYPVKLLDQIVRLSKCLKLKRDRVTTLRELNSLGERKKSFGEYINEDFQRKYAATVIDLSQINRDLNEFLKNIKESTQEFSSEAGPTISLPNIIREGCQEDAYDMVNKSNTAEDKEYVENPKILALISSLTALMLQVKHLAEGDRNAFELQALQDSISEIRQNVSKSNLCRFENSVEVHMQHIQSGLSQLGNLHAFMIPPNSSSNNSSVAASPAALLLGSSTSSSLTSSPTKVKVEPF